MKIDNNVPPPRSVNYSKEANRLIEKLEKGNSVLFDKQDGEKVRMALYTNLLRRGITDKKFVTRSDKEQNGIRIWRVF